MLIIYGNTRKNEQQKLKEGVWSIASDLFFLIPTQITQQKRERNLYTVEMWLFFKKHRFFPKTNLVTLLNFFVYSDYWEKIGFSCWLCQKFQWYQILYSFFTFEWKSGIGFFIVAAMNFLVAFLNALVDK